LKYSKEWFTEQEIKKLFEYPNISSRDLLLVRVCYYGAFRISEVLVSKREDYELDDIYTYLILRKQKTDKMNWERQPIPPFTYGEVIRYCNDNNIKTQDYVFQTQKSHGSYMSYSMAYFIVKKYVKLAGMDKEITTHSFRRSRATHLLDDGLELYDVSKFLRHKSIVTTMKYLKISKKKLFDKVYKIDNKSIFDKI